MALGDWWRPRPRQPIDAVQRGDLVTFRERRVVEDGVDEVVDRGHALGVGKREPLETGWELTGQPVDRDQRPIGRGSLDRTSVGGVIALADVDREAFEAALGVDMTTFGEAWLEALGAAAPTKYGPQPAPAGPIPSAWLGEPGGSAPPAASGDVTASPGPTAGGGTSADPTGVVLVVVVLALVLAVGVAVFLVRRRRAGTGPVG